MAFLPADALAAFAPEVDQEYERVPMLMKDGSRWEMTGRKDHARVRIVAVPGGRRTKVGYVKIDPKPMGNGRPDRGVKRAKPEHFVRHYALVGADGKVTYPDAPPFGKRKNRGAST